MRGVGSFRPTPPMPGVGREQRSQPRQAQEKAPLQRGQISPLQLRFWNRGSCRFPSVCKDNSGAQGSFRHIPPQFCRRRIKGRGPAMAKRTAAFVRWFESVKANQWALIALAPAVALPSPLDRSPTYGAAVAALWFQSQGHQQEEWPCRHGHDHGPGALC